VKKISVMHLLTSFQVGGAETVALQLCRAMNGSVYRILACCLKKSGPMASRFQAAGVETFALSNCRTMRGLDLALLSRLVTLLRRERVHLLHCHNSFPREYGAMAAMLSGVPVVVGTQHAVWSDGTIERPPILARLMNPFVTHFVAVADHVLQAATSTGHIQRERASVIYNGVDVRRFRPRRYRTPKQSNIEIGCVARLSHEKRHDVLLQAIAQLAPKYKNVRLHLVGDGPSRGALETQAGYLGLGRNVRFLGLRNDVPEWLRAMEVLVLGSATEGLPLTILEAMASGLPVVATSVGGVPEMVEDGVNGFLVPPEDPVALAAALERLVKDRDLRLRMGRKGREIAVKKFSLDIAVRKHEELYLKLLREKGIRVG